MPKTSLQGKPICITGASSGIGAATAIACARAGMPVVLAARRTDRLEALADQIRASGGQALPIACDVTDPDACRAMVDACIAQFGSIFSVFANAGYGFIQPFHKSTDDEWRGIFETNLWGTTNAIRAALPHLLHARSGHILICSSCLARFAIPNYGHYCATKAAQAQLATSMRHELRPLGVHVSSVHPVGTATEFFEVSQAIGGRPDPVIQQTRRFIQPPERVAKAIVRCLQRPRPEVWTSLPMRAIAAGITLCPTWADWAMRRAGPVELHSEGALGPDVDRELAA